MGSVGQQVSYNTSSMQDWSKCSICFSTYNESIPRPRTLNCGHTFCGKCLSSTIQNGFLTCPRCRKVHEIDSALNLPVNFDLEGLVKLLNPHSQDDNEAPISKTLKREPDSGEQSKVIGSLMNRHEKSLSAQKELHKTSAGLCHDHPCNELKFRCSLHKCWVCEQCISDQGDHPKHNCRVITFKEEIEDRKKEHIKTLDDEYRFLFDTVDNIETHISDLNSEKRSRAELLKLLKDLVKKHEKEEETIQKEIASFKKILIEGDKVKKSLLDVKLYISKAATLDESNTARDDIKSKTTEVKRWANRTQKITNDGKLVLEEVDYSLMATSASLDYRSGISEASKKFSFGFLKALKEKKLGPLEKVSEMISSQCVQLMIKNLNGITYRYKDELDDVARSMNMSLNSSEIITKVQLIFFGLMWKIFHLQDNETNTWAVKYYPNNSRFRAGPITILDGRIVLHTLRPYDIHDGKKPTMPIMLPFEDVRQLYNSNSMIFLGIDEGLAFKGYVHIDLYDETSRGKAMISYCTGEEGWSYINTGAVTNKENNWISFGSYSPHNPFPTSLIKSHQTHYTSCRAGTLTPAYFTHGQHGPLVCNDGRFGIKLFPDPSPQIDSFGRVVTGLSLMKSLVFEKNYSIGVCGIII